MTFGKYAACGLACALAFLPVVSCGGDSPALPTAPSPTTPAPSPTQTALGVGLIGRALDVLNSSPKEAITIRLPTGESTTTDVNGTFTIASPTAGQFTATLSGSAVVERQTGLRFPGPEAQVTLIPSSFDLATFDQMCRGGGMLRRWESAPKLVIIDAVLAFSSVSASAYTATSERLTTAEIGAIAADLAWGLPQVTGGAFADFASVSTESPAPGSQVPFFTREGAIVVARFYGLRSETSYAGYGRWAARSNVVVAGAVMLDRDFEVFGSPYRRTLRVHELGHALGWDHVTLRTSFMNTSGAIEPNAFDKDATRLAYLRPPGNQSPDRDPSPFSANFRSYPLVWGAITP